MRRTSFWERLDRPLSQAACVWGWVAATAAYVVVVVVLGGPATGDSQESIYAAWSLAHGHLSCGYPPPGQPGYAATAPVYVLVSGAISALLRIGHGAAFPSQAALGPHCSNAVAAMNRWSIQTGALRPTLWIGIVGWLVLATGVVWFLRASGRGRRVWEPVALGLVACLAPVYLCFTEFFHPQDLVAMGLILLALAGIRRRSWLVAGAVLGLAAVTQQYALLVAVPLLVVAPARGRVRLMGAAVASVVVIAAPMALLTAGRSLPSTLVGTGESSAASSLLVLTGAHGPLLFSLSRIVPIALAGLVAGWASERLGDDVLGALPLIALTAVSLSLRLPFEVNVWGYYLMAVAVALALVDVIGGRIRLGFVVWVAIVVLAALGGVLDYAPTFLPFPIWFWQLVVDAGALALAASALMATVRDGGTTATTSQSRSAAWVGRAAE